MAEEITLGMILSHIHTMKGELLQKITHLEEKMDRGFAVIDQRFEDTNLRIQAVQEDLYETMRVQAGHKRKLARL